MNYSDESNPFAPIRAADFTDEQINELWVELGGNWLTAVLEPRSIVSKYILGSKGSGKTHLLRYHSYPAARLRSPEKSGVSLVNDAGCLVVFLRTTNMDAGRFELDGAPEPALQQLFSVHLELKLAELVIGALSDIRETTAPAAFDDVAFLRQLSPSILDTSFEHLKDLNEFRSWTGTWLRKLDTATNDAAFTGNFNLQLPFSVGGLALPLGAALRAWNNSFSQTNLIYILDEIENLSEKQQQVVNTLVRYAEGRVAFRLTGRLYARKTLATIAGGEENREGSEFTVIRLDEILRRLKNYSDFATRFIAKRIGVIAPHGGRRTSAAGFDPRSNFEEVDVDKFAARHAQVAAESRFARLFRAALSASTILRGNEDALVGTLTLDVPPIFQRLNVLLFCKRFGAKKGAVELASEIRRDCGQFLTSQLPPKAAYRTAVGHWKLDVFAQLCRESRRRDAGVPYAGFGTFVAMSSHNPRNLLVLMGKVFEIAAFRDGEAANARKFSVDVQTTAAIEAARFCFEGDSNYGRRSDQAREAVSRLAELLRTARYSLNIPEVSPLAISFDSNDLNAESRATLESAYNYSLLFEVDRGRPDRNTQRLRQKVQLSPMLSPRWGLPIGRRGDISINAAMLNAIFDPANRSAFDLLLRQYSQKWNFPFSPPPVDFSQDKLF